MQATASDDSTWKLWGLPDGDIIMSGEGHTDWVAALDFHPGGACIASGGADCAVKACSSQYFLMHALDVAGMNIVEYIHWVWQGRSNDGAFAGLGFCEAEMRCNTERALSCCVVSIVS